MKTTPAKFTREVRQEISKITWPTRKETTITAFMVFVFVFICAVFFLVVDQVIAYALKLILGVGV
ncbi:MAG: preprotein translocase subunit SecE [Alphaproteobacteria bacterium]